MMTAVTAGDAYRALLIEYASGCLDEAHALLVATHLALSPAAREEVSRLEQVGGSLLAGCCEPVAMTDGALDAVMARLDGLSCGPRPRAAPPRSCREIKGMPSCLGRYVETVEWRCAGGGLDRIELRTRCLASRAELLRLGSHRAFVPPRGSRAIVVLDGRLGADGVFYGKGDLVVLPAAPAYRSDEQDGCTALIVRRGHHGWAGDLLRWLRGKPRGGR